MAYQGGDGRRRDRGGLERRCAWLLDRSWGMVAGEGWIDVCGVDFPQWRVMIVSQ